MTKSLILCQIPVNMSHTSAIRRKSIQDYIWGGAYMMTADIIPSLLKSIDDYPLCVLQVDDVFITGIVAEIATNPTIPRTRAKHIKVMKCDDECQLYVTPILYECNTAELSQNFWSKWKNTTYEQCFPGMPIPTETMTTDSKHWFEYTKWRRDRRVVQSIIDLDSNHYYYFVIIIVFIAISYDLYLYFHWIHLKEYFNKFCYFKIVV